MLNPMSSSVCLSSASLRVAQNLCSEDVDMATVEELQAVFLFSGIAKADELHGFLSFAMMVSTS